MVIIFYLKMLNESKMLSFLKKFEIKYYKKKYIKINLGDYFNKDICI